MRTLGAVWALLALLAALADCGAGEQAPKERVVDLGGGLKMTLVLIPAGTFTMGSTEAEIKAVYAKWALASDKWFHDEKPAHKVRLCKAFWMGKHEVTVGQFRRFVEASVGISLTCGTTPSGSGWFSPQDPDCRFS